MSALDREIARLEARLKRLKRHRGDVRRRQAWRDRSKLVKHGEAISHARIAGHPDFAGLTRGQIDAYRAYRKAGYCRREALAVVAAS